MEICPEVGDVASGTGKGQLKRWNMQMDVAKPPKEIESEESRDVCPPSGSAEPDAQIGKVLPVDRHVTDEIAVSLTRHGCKVSRIEQRVASRDAYRRNWCERADDHLEETVLRGPADLQRNDEPTECWMCAQLEGELTRASHAEAPLL